MTKFWTTVAVALFFGSALAAIFGVSHNPIVREARAQQTGPIYCSQMAVAAANFTTKTALTPVPGSASLRTYVCGFTVSAVGASIITFQYGTGSACATGSTAIGPTIQLGATSTYDDGVGIFRGFVVPAGQGLCATATAAANAVVYYALQ